MIGNPRLVATFVLIVFSVAIPSRASAREPSNRPAPLTFEVDLPSQPLDRALFQFSHLTGAQLMFNDGNVARARAPALKGTFTMEKLLDALLEGTGYAYRFTDERTVRVFADDEPAKRKRTIQDVTPAPEADTQAAATLEEIIVAGSYLPGAVTMGVNPVTVLGRDTIDALGVATLGEVMRAIANSGATEFHDQNEGPNDARGDVASVNLRELGSGNTLVLLNGRRLVTHPTDQAISSVPAMVVNVNMIPMAAVERIEILRDGASALYGADATAGVINIVTGGRLDGVKVAPRFGVAGNTGLREATLDLAGGVSFNEARSNLSVYGTWFKSNGFLASEQRRTADSDLRSWAPLPWRLTDDFDRRSSRTPFGEFQAGVLDTGTREFSPVRVRSGSVGATSNDGRFHIQPRGFDPTDSSVFAHGSNVEVDDGSVPRALYYNTNELRGISPDTRRISVLSVFDHKFDPDLSFNAELSMYRADSVIPRAAISLDQDLGDIIVPRTNYYNPFGAAMSPNRLPAIDAPADGLDILIRRYRPLEMGGRSVEVGNRAWRALVGLQGQLGSWRWESALLQSEARSHDTEINRISKTLFQQQLALATPDAFNPFGGEGVNPAATLDAVRIAIDRDSESSLRSWDLRLVNPAIASIAGGDIGLASGIAWRKEAYVDDRDPRVDGTIRASDGELSDVVGVSPTPDSHGSRQAQSAFVELRAPLVSESNALPAVNRLDLQIAGRYEHLDDIDEGVFAPKIAVGWKPVAALLVRATYGEGFQAPNLVILNHGRLKRLNSGQEDFWRSPATGLPEDTGVFSRNSTREGNPDLDPQRSRTYVLGLAFQPQTARDFTVSIDYWGFRQTGIVDNLGVENQLALDFLLRKRGSFNPQVQRIAPTEADLADFAAWNAANPDDQRAAAGAAVNVIDPYLNLQPRRARGIDVSMRYRTPRTPAGTFDVTLEATRLLEYHQQNAVFDLLQKMLRETNLSEPETAVILDEIGAAIDPDRIELNGNPRWKGTFIAEWHRNRWNAGTSVQYLGRFLDTSARHPQSGEPWPVDDWLIVNSHVEYRFARRWLDRLRLGVRNLFDEDAPLADEDFGFYSDYHDAKGRFYYLQGSMDF